MNTARILVVIALLIAGCGLSPATPSAKPAVGAREAQQAHDLQFHGDDFYAIPDPMPTGRPGSLIHLQIRYRQADGRGYRVMYRSVGIDGVSPMVMTGFIWIPPTEAPHGGWPIVAWAPMYDGVGDECAYSRNSHRGYDEVMKSLLADGFVVAVTDYEGHGTQSTYLDGIPESGAHAVLDAARAAHDLLGSAASDRVVIAGHGLGGWVVSQAQNYTKAYADGLDIRGAVVIDGGGDPVRAASGIATPDDIGALGSLRAVRAYVAAYPELRADALLTPYGMELLSTLHEDGCVPFPELDVVPILDISTVDAMQVEGWADRIRAHSPHQAPYPALYVVGRDGWIPVDWVREVVDQLCALGGRVELREYPAPNHDSVIVAAYSDWGKWLIDRVTDDPPVNACDT